MANFSYETYLHELWEERAAIREYDGEESRQWDDIVGKYCEIDTWAMDQATKDSR